ncbi:N-acylglucosamine 2-epimerase [Legionella adelaidensis]|uniref:N-acylglucosamine 2-epimerase n=1 Tax=Legionella adelaidensis TaxID=45056 RepID=A0A0W0R4V8_9GAMM|nr:UDP-N-acetylglucosamine 2-epimerase [Legionella adelaidensis]KTC66088.1 N-acylglucosamine 2-epimerase [Legionella adelaidensis]
MRKVAVFTGTRAEYGLLSGLMQSIKDNPHLELQVITGGMHHSPEFGETWREIEKDGFSIDAKVEMLLSSDTAVGVVKAMGLGTIGFADALDRLLPHILVLLGDRFEALSIAQAAMIMRIPILHIHGGEVTEGAYDDAIRHSISKMSTVHCTATEAYRARVIQLGEDPSRVFNVGAIGLDYLKSISFLSKEELSQSLNFALNSPFFLVTFHPVTWGSHSVKDCLAALFEALDAFPDFQLIITYPNADNEGRKIISLIQEYCKKDTTNRVLAVQSLGHTRYLSLLKLAEVVIGNSSSGIIEASSLKTPTVNIGERQRGRIAASSVVHCDPSADAIKKAITLALNNKNPDTFINPYEKGGAIPKIIKIIEEMPLVAQKIFFDIGTLNEFD